MIQTFDPAGSFAVECRDRLGNLIWREEFPNGVTTPGITDLLSAGFAGGTQRPNWYVGLIDGDDFDDVSADDTMASHAGWAELTDYSGDRPAWSLTVAAGVAVTGTPAGYTLSAACSARGLFITSNATKGGATGILWSTGLFNAARALSSGSTLSVIYTLRGAGGAQ